LFYSATLLPLKSHFSILGLMRLSMGIVTQLRSTEGVVRYAVKTDLPRKTFQTFTVWTGPEAMRAFVRTELHRTAVAKFWDWRQEGGGATVEWTETDRPVVWQEINERLKEPTFVFTRRD
jgi:quinol monooxygenase YgiN